MKKILLLTVLFLNPALLLAAEKTDSKTSTGTNANADAFLEFFSRNPGKPYMESDKTGRIHFIQDLLEVYDIDKAERKNFFFMEAPSSKDFGENIDRIEKLKILTPTEKPNPLSKRENTSYHFLDRGILKKKTVTDKDSKVNVDFPIEGIPGDSQDRLERVGSANTFVEYHFKNYCDDYDGDNGSDSKEICKAFIQSSDGTINTDKPSADINASSLFDFQKDEDTIAARDYIQNITDAFPQNPFSYSKNQGSITVDPDKKNYDQVSKKLVDKAYRSLSQYVLNDIKNRRIPSKDENDEKSSLSKKQLIEELATTRIKKQSHWLTKLESTSTEGLLREIAVIEASRLYLDSIAIQQNEHIEALLATIVAQNQNVAKLADFSSNFDESEAGKSSNSMTKNIAQNPFG